MTAPVKRLRRCRFCHLVLDETAPLHTDADQPKDGNRKVRSHCPSRNCDWCLPCIAIRTAQQQPGA